MDENKQLAQRIDGAIQCAKQEVANLRAELTATGHRLAELGELEEPGEPQEHQQQQQNHPGKEPHLGVCDRSNITYLCALRVNDRTLTLPSIHSVSGLGR